MTKGGIENPIIGKEVTPKMGKLKQSRLPETGKGNKPVQIWGPENGRVEMLVLGKRIVLGYRVENGKFNPIVVSEMMEKQVYDPVNHELPGDLEKKAKKRGFAMLRKEAKEKYPILRHRDKWKEHMGKQPDLLE